MNWNPGIKDALLRLVAKNAQVESELRVRLAEMAARDARLKAFHEAHPPLVLSSRTLLALWTAEPDASSDQRIDSWDAQYLSAWFLK